MSDDEPDLELLELLRQSLGISKAPSNEVSQNTNVLRDAEFINNNAIDVSIDMYATKAAAVSIYRNMQDRGYSTKSWGQHELHPRVDDGFTEVDLVNFVFTMDLLNFSFWSELPEHDRFQVEYKEKRWTGYNSLVACLRRALDDGIPVTTPRFWRSRQCTTELLSNVFRSSTREPMPLLEERIAILREASTILFEDFADAEDEGLDDDENDEPDIKHGLAATDVVNGTPPNADSVEANELEDNSALALASELMEPQRGPLQTSDIESQHAATSTDETENALEVSRGQAVAKSGTATEEPQDQNADGRTVEPCDTKLTATGTDSDPDLTPKAGAPDLTVVHLIEGASKSAGKLVNLLAKHFPCFRDETRFEGRRVRFLKRAQILVADVWAALDGTGCGEFHDIDHLTMFADYRVPQMLHSLGVIRYSPPLEYHVSAMKRLETGHSWEVQLRGCSIWAVELIRREIEKAHPASTTNAVLIDFFLYDLAKERERGGELHSPSCDD